MSYISQVDYKKLMSNFQKGTPKGLLKELHSMKHDGAGESQHLPADAEEGLEKEGNAFTAGLAKAKKGQEFKVDGKSVKDTSNYDSDLEEYQFDQMYPDDPGPFEGEMEESGHGDEPFDFEKHAIESTSGDKIGRTEKDDYGRTIYWSAKEPKLLCYYVGDDDKIYKKDYKIGIVTPIGDLNQYDEPTPDYGDPGADYNDGEFWEAEVKKLKEIAGIKSHDDGPEDDDEDREARAKKMEDDDTEAENAEREDLDEDDQQLASFENALKHALLFKGLIPSSRSPIPHPMSTKEMVAKYGGLDPKEAAAKYIKEKHPYKTSNRKYDYTARTTNVGSTGSELEFNVVNVTPEDFTIDYKVVPNSSNKSIGASRNYTPSAQEGTQTLKKDPANPKELRIGAERFTVLSDGFEKQVYGGGEMEEGFNPDESDFERAVAEELESLPAEALTDKEYQKALELLEDPKIVSKLWDVHPRKAAMALAKMVRGKEVEEGLHMPPLQATGQTVVTNEDAITNPGMGFGVLSPDERQQLKEYINSYRTIKSEISKLLEKAGKSGKIMEGIKEDEAVPAERKAKYKDPTTVPTHHKHSNLGGNRTGLVMTKAEMWENEEHEEGAHERIEGMLDTKLHDAFHKVTGMIMKDLMADGFDEGDIKNFLQHEIDEKAKEAINAQHDF